MNNNIKAKWEINVKCKGCEYEFADGRTSAISNCVCCSRIYSKAKYDNYTLKK